MYPHPSGPGFKADTPGFTFVDALRVAHGLNVRSMEAEGENLTGVKHAAGTVNLIDGRQFRVMVELLPIEQPE